MTIAGFALLNKPKGLSSQQAIYHLRKKLGLPKNIKIGHGGTLDPLATGMLVIALGSATKFLEYLLNANKTYVVTAKLGQVTTTLDAEGEVLSERPVPEFKPADLQALFKQFTGPIEQVPPMYSALKFQGKPLYHYARKGEDIERKPRAVHVYELKLEQNEPAKFSFTTRVSKGTYIRSLVHDMGQVLGCGAHVEQLHRAQVDPFQSEKMLELEQMDLEQLIAIESIFTELEPLYFNSVDLKKLKSGQKLSTIPVNCEALDTLYRAYDQENNQFVGLLKIDEQRRIMGEKWV